MRPMGRSAAVRREMSFMMAADEGTEWLFFFGGV